MEKNSNLQLTELSLYFANVSAVSNLSMQVKAGTVHGLIGPNGAGKTSVLNCISGVYKPRHGSIRYKGKDITSLKPHARQALGIGRTFQNVEIFKGMTVLECLMFGRHLQSKYNIFSAAIYKGSAEREELRNRRVVEEEIIDFLEIENIREAVVGSLPYGLQKRVSFGIALALLPDVIMLDEPMAGLNLEEREDMTRFITDANEEKGISFLIVEHDMGVVMDISDVITVLNFGVKVCEGEPSAVQNNPDVIKAYLG
jgi:branched-chain amino acid transport system ATP-binding protein